MTVYTPRYLAGLWHLCSSKGALLERRAIQSLSELSSYDQIVLAMGSGLFQFAECSSLPLEPLRGRAAVCRWREPRPPFALSSLGHLTPTDDPLLCQIGSTYERGAARALTDAQVFLELREKVAAFYPPASAFELVEMRSGD